VSSRTWLQKGQHIEIRKDAIVAVLASESSLDRFWFFQLAVDVIADETDWVTKRLKGRNLDPLVQKQRHYLSGKSGL